MTPIETWVSALLTIAVLSLMYKENPVYSAAEHIYVGLSAGHFVVMGYINITNMALKPLAKGQLIAIVPIVLGLLLYSRFVSRISWLSRYPISLLTGLGVGMTLRGAITADFVSQIKAAMVPLNTVNNLLMVAITASVLMFFLFVRTSKHPAMNGVTRFGRWSMMVAFGATFGGTVMGAMTLLAGRVQFLLSLFPKK